MRPGGLPTTQTASFRELGLNLDPIQADPAQETISTFFATFHDDKKVFWKVFRHEVSSHVLLCPCNEIGGWHAY